MWIHFCSFLLKAECCLCCDVSELYRLTVALGEKISFEHHMTPATNFLSTHYRVRLCVNMYALSLTHLRRVSDATQAVSRLSVCL